MFKIGTKIRCIDLSNVPNEFKARGLKSDLILTIVQLGRYEADTMRCEVKIGENIESFSLFAKEIQKVGGRESKDIKCMPDFRGTDGERIKIPC